MNTTKDAKDIHEEVLAIFLAGQQEAEMLAKERADGLAEDQAEIIAKATDVFHQQTKRHGNGVTTLFIAISLMLGYWYLSKVTPFDLLLAISILMAIFGGWLLDKRPTPKIMLTQ